MQHNSKSRELIARMLLVLFIIFLTLPTIVLVANTTANSTVEDYNPNNLIDNMYKSLKDTGKFSSEETTPVSMLGEMGRYLNEGSFLRNDPTVGDYDYGTKSEQSRAMESLKQAYKELAIEKNAEELYNTQELIDRMYEIMVRYNETDYIINGYREVEDENYEYEEDESGEIINREPMAYPGDFDYPKALEDSFIVSQYIRPFESSMYWILQDKEFKESLPSLYTEETNLAVNINYRDIYYRDANGEKVLARVKDLFNVKASGEGTEFFIEYWEEKLDEDGEPYIVFEDLRVYYTNPYSYFYLTLALSDSQGRVTRLKQSAKDIVQLDNYGNIVLNNNNDLNHAIVLPNYANPDLTNKKEFYLPSRLFLIKYDTANLNNAVVWSEESNWPDDVKASTFKSKIGSVLQPHSISMYDSKSSTRTVMQGSTSYDTLVNSVSILASDKLIEVSQVIGTVPDSSEAYAKYLGANDGKYANPYDIYNDDSLVFVLGNAHTQYMMNRYQSDIKLYQSLEEIAVTGIFGKVNSSFMYLPKSLIHMGPANLGFKKYTVPLKETLLDAGGSWAPYMHLAGNKGVDIFNQEGKWGSGATTSEVFLIRSMLEDYVKDIDSSKMDLIAFYSTNVIDKTDNAIPVTPDGEEMSTSEQKSNSIIDIMHYMLNNIGSSMVAIQTSKMSITYKNIMSNLEENYLFHVSNILESETMGKLITVYMRIVIWINLIWFIYWTFRMFSGKDGGFIEVIKKFGFVVILSTLPLAVLIYYCMGAEMYTSAVFKDTFVYWSLVDMDIVNRQSDVDRQYVIDEMEFFRESGRISYENHGTVEVYGLTSNSKDTSTELEFIKATLTAKETDTSKKPDTNEITVITLSDIVSKGVPSGSNKEGIMANKANYDSSIFYYFYDTFRYHYYSYYEQEINSEVNNDFFNDRGMTSSLNRFREMVTNPYFLYGKDYDVEDSKTFEPQDILGLSNLFSKDTVNGRASYYEDIYSSPWYGLIQSNTRRTHTMKSTGEAPRDATDPYNYPEGFISGIYLKDEPDRKYTNFEIALREVNANTAIELQKMHDYSMYTDESLLFISSLIATMEFNKTMNKYMRPTTDLVPVAFNSQSYSLDTIFRSMFLENSNQEQTYRGDLMWSVESQGGIIIQALIIVTAFVGQISGLLNLVAVLMLFITACLVFLVAYNISRDFFNEAWIGLISLFGVLLVIHMLFILLVYWICVPVTSVIQVSIFKGYSNGIRTMLMLFALVLRSIAVAVVLFFMAKNYKDLGGSIIMENLEGFVGNMTGKAEHSGPMDSRSDNVNIAGGVVTMDTQVGNGVNEWDNTNIDNSPEIAREEAEGAMNSEKLSEEKEISEERIGKESIQDKNVTTNNEKESSSTSSDKEVVGGADSSESSSRESSTETSQTEVERNDKSDSKESTKDYSKSETSNETSKDKDHTEKDISNNNTSKESKVNNNTSTHIDTSSSSRDSSTNNNNSTGSDSTGSVQGGKSKSSEGKEEEVEMSETNKILQELAGIMGDPEGDKDSSEGGNVGGIFSNEKKSDEE